MRGVIMCCLVTPGSGISLITPITEPKFSEMRLPGVALNEVQMDSISH